MAPGPSPGRGTLILVPFLIYVTVDYVFRLNNAMIAPALVIEFALDPSELGFVTGAFFAAFALTQLPLGLALDRFGPGAVVTALLCVALLGGGVYLSATDKTGLTIGRFLIGIGMAASLRGGVKAASLWFPPERLPQITALHVALSGVGGMLATGPMATVLALAGWRAVMAGLLCICVVVMVLLRLWVPGGRAGQPAPGLATQLREYRDLLSSLRFWHMTPVVVAGVGVGIGYQTLWASLWLRDVAGYGDIARAWTLFAMFAGVLVGNLGFGWWVRRRLAVGADISRATIAGYGVMILAQLALIAIGGGRAPAILWITVSLFFACPIVGYAIVAQGFPPSLSGRVASAVNALVFAAVFATQWASGVIIEAFPHDPAGGYDPLGHRVGLGCAIAVQTLALAWFLIISRRHNQSEN